MSDYHKNVIASILPDLQVELEELNECGTLEERLEKAEQIAAWESSHGTRGCSFCDGFGYTDEYGADVSCDPCKGLGMYPLP